MGAGTFCIILGVGIREHDLYHAISDPQQKGFMALVGIGILLFILAFVNLCIVNQEMKAVNRHLLNLTNLWIFAVSSFCLYHLIREPEESLEKNFHDQCEDQTSYMANFDNFVKQSSNILCSIWCPCTPEQALPTGNESSRRIQDCVNF